MTLENKRVHARAQYFLIKHKDDLVPIYAFRGEQDVSSVPGVIVDLGEGGVQLLTAGVSNLAEQVYDLELVTEASSDASRSVARVQKIWSREDGINVRTGFSFSEPSSMGATWLGTLQAADNQLLRCVLHPV
jgi:hypothetical protein